MTQGGGRLIRGGYRVLLVAMAIQGLTPDGGNLASPWLLRLIGTGPADVTAARSDDARPTPLHGEDGDDTSGNLCEAVAPAAAMRVRLQDGGRPCPSFSAADLGEWPRRPAPRSIPPSGPNLRGPHGLISSLCRFLC